MSPGFDGVTSDTLILSTSTGRLPAGTEVFELGTGDGAAILLASVRNPGCRWVGIDCRKKGLGNFRRAVFRNPDFGIVCGLVEDVPVIFPASIADLVMTNPPYLVSGKGRKSPDEERCITRTGGSLLLYSFIKAASHLLRSGGRMIMVNRPSELCRIITGCRAFDLNIFQIQPVGEPGRPARLVVIHSVKSVKNSLKLLPQKTVEEIMA